MTANFELTCTRHVASMLDGFDYTTEGQGCLSDTLNARVSLSCKSASCSFSYDLSDYQEAQKDPPQMLIRWLFTTTIKSFMANNCEYSDFCEMSSNMGKSNQDYAMAKTSDPEQFDRWQSLRMTWQNLVRLFGESELNKIVAFYMSGVRL